MSFSQLNEQTFNRLKNGGLEQPRWYGFNRYLLHVQLCFLMHDFEFFSFATPIIIQKGQPSCRMKACPINL